MPKIRVENPYSFELSHMAKQEDRQQRAMYKRLGIPYPYSKPIKKAKPVLSPRMKEIVDELKKIQKARKAKTASKKKGTGLLPRPAKTARKRSNPMAKHRRGAKARMAYARSFLKKAKRKRKNPATRTYKFGGKTHTTHRGYGIGRKTKAKKATAKRRYKSRISKSVVSKIRRMVFHPAPDAIPVHRRKGVVKAHLRRVNPKRRHHSRRRRNPFGLSRMPIQNLIIKSMTIVVGLIAGTKMTQFYSKIPLINRIPAKYIGIVNLLGGAIGAIKVRNEHLKVLMGGIAVQGAYDLVAQNFGTQIGIKPMEGDDEFLGYQPMFGDNLFSGENINNFSGENVDNLRGDVVHINGETYNVIGDDPVDMYGGADMFLGDMDI